MRLPGPPDSSVSQLGRLRKDFLGYLLDAAHYGPLVQLKPAPGMRILLVNHPDLIEEILAGNPEHYRKSAMTHRLVGRFLGQGLVLAEGKAHRSARRRMQPAFTGARLSRLVPQMAEVAEQWLQQWPAGESRLLPDALSQLMMRVVARTLFGVQDHRNASEVGIAMQQFAESLASRFQSVPLPSWLPTARHRRERSAIAALDASIAALPNGKGDDLLAALRAEEGFTPGELRDHLVTLYFAGHETTAKLLSWTLWRLAEHRQIGARVAAELDALDKPALAGTPNAAPYTEAVVKEVLRLHPSAWVFDRETATTVMLGGHKLPAGTVLYLSPYVSQRDELAFADPERFEPERFLAPNLAPARGQYFPFGFGPRNCIGRGFAESATRVLLAALLPRVRLIPGARPAPLPGATLGMVNPPVLQLR